MDDCYWPRPLLSLPPEIRSRIYYEALRNEVAIDITSHLGATPGLLQTCSLIRQEATAMYYANNIFTSYVNYDIEHYAIKIAQCLRTLDPMSCWIMNSFLVRNEEYSSRAEGSRALEVVYDTCRKAGVGLRPGVLSVLLQLRYGEEYEYEWYDGESTAREHVSGGGDGGARPDDV